MAKILKCHKTLLIYLLSDSIFLIPPIQSRTTYTDTIKCQCRHKPAWHRDISATGEGVGFRNAKPNHSESSDTELLIPPLWAGPGIKVSWHMGRSKQPLLLCTQQSSGVKTQPAGPIPAYWMCVWCSSGDACRVWGVPAETSCSGGVRCRTTRQPPHTSAPWLGWVRQH